MLFAVFVMPAAVGTVRVVEGITAKLAKAAQAWKLKKVVSNLQKTAQRDGQGEVGDLVLVEQPVQVYTAKELQDLYEPATSHQQKVEIITHAKERADQVKATWPAKCSCCGRMRPLSEVLQ